MESVISGTKRLLPIVMAIACCLLTTAPLHADAVKDKLDSLEASIKQFQADSVSRNQQVASALSTIDRLKEEYRSLQGTLEANTHLIQEQLSEITRLKRDLSDRLNAIEDRLEIYDQQITKAVTKVMPGAANETEAYQKALDMVQKSDFLSAVAAFRSFLKTYPKSELSDNAQYWIGECYFALKDYPKAIKEFQAMIDKYPRAAKAPSAILKQGYSFVELGMNEEGKTFLNKVINNYPSSEEAKRAKEKLDRMDQKSAAPTAPAGNGATFNSPLDSTSHIPLAPGLRDQQAAPKPEEKSDLILPGKGKN